MSLTAPSLTPVTRLTALQDQAHFSQLVQAHSQVVILFTASWCAPCQTFLPVLSSVAEQAAPWVFAVADVDVATTLATHFQVTQVPALMVVRERVIIDMVRGAMHAHELTHHLQMWSAIDLSAIQQHFERR